ncbi:MAG: DUF4382 domain-containing protein [Bacteroidota bacterium]|nr:DUF4382 domain-containing protein [Bacteroidota bacterium]
MAILLGFSSCDNSKESSGKATLNVSLTDAPGDFSEVNVEVLGVEINKEEQATETGWQPLTMEETGTINLLDLSNGKSALLASAELPAGKISQIRLKLGSNNTLKLKDGSIVKLTTPSGQTSGLKLQINQELEADVTYEILLDFDAAKSVVKRGNSGQYNLKPVIRTITQAVAGGIRGKVTPIEAKAGILVLNAAATDTLAGGFADATTGDFLIKGITAGTYKVEFSSTAPYQEKVVKEVTVTNTSITDVGSINMNP